ncbi:MAG: Clp protease N-terminal domain-containing protein [Acidimicrobiales bacterium]
MQEQFSLDDHARLALDVARHAALANGDSYCGTEYLLYGVIATARGEISELVELFALNTLRVDRAIERIMERRQLEGRLAPGEPTLSERAVRALHTPRLDGQGPTGVFELLHGLLSDAESGACSVARDLGVQPSEALRLVAYGMRHLSRDEIDDLLDKLDRRDQPHRPWWGPDPETPLVPYRRATDAPLTLATSDSAVVELTGVGTDGVGVGFTMTVRSKRSWVLPPVFVPEEALVPGVGSSFSSGPDFFLLQFVLADGTVLDNRSAGNRYVADIPEGARLVPLGQREQRTVLNDRRRHDQHAVTTDWWVWPLPKSGVVELRVDWPAESVSGIWSFDATGLAHSARPS